MSEPPGTGLDATGERLVPELQHGELVHAEHLARYRLASQLASGRRVLDAACGEGYGTAMLATGGAARAVGVDIDEWTVSHARERYGLDFQVADVASLPFEDGSFDLVVSFETLEHVPDADAMLAELRRVLSDDGLLLISTPNKHSYLVENEFHTREFTHEEFVELMRGLFPSVRLLYQQNWVASAVLEEEALRAEERPLDVELTKVVSAEPGRELYTLALCGRDTDAALKQVAVAAGVDEAHELARRTVEAERSAATWHEEYEKAEGVAKQWHDQYKDAERGLHEAMDTARWMRSTLSWRLTKPFRAPAKLFRRRER